MVDGDNWRVGVAKQLLSQFFILKYRETALELADVALRLLKVVKHVLVASLDEDVVLLCIEDLGPSPVLALLPLPHPSAPELEALGHLVLEVRVRDVVWKNQMFL